MVLKLNMVPFQPKSFCEICISPSLSQAVSLASKLVRAALSLSCCPCSGGDAQEAKPWHGATWWCSKLSLHSAGQGDFPNHGSSLSGSSYSPKALSHGKAAPAAVGTGTLQCPCSPWAVWDSAETRAEVPEPSKGKPCVGRAVKHHFSGLF